MSLSEQIEATQEGLVYLKEKRDNQKHAVHNVPIAAFHDICSTISSIEDQVRCLLV